MTVLSRFHLWARQRELLQRHAETGDLEEGTDLLEMMLNLPGADRTAAKEKTSEATELEESARATFEQELQELGEADAGARLNAALEKATRLREEADSLGGCASTESTEALTGSLAVELAGPVSALHGSATGKSMLAGAQLANIGLGDNACTPDQMQIDSSVLTSKVKASLEHGEDGNLLVENGKFVGTATLGKATLKNAQTCVLISTNSLRAEDPDDARADSVLKEMDASGPALAALADAVRKGRPSRKLRADLLFYLAEDIEALSAGVWHARAVRERPGLASALVRGLGRPAPLPSALDPPPSCRPVAPAIAGLVARAFRAKGAAPALWHRHQDREKEGVTLRLAMSLTKGGGFDVAPSSMGHDATTLMRDVLQAHLLTYDFYTQGAPTAAPAHAARAAIFAALCCPRARAQESDSPPLRLPVPRRSHALLAPRLAAQGRRRDARADPARLHPR